MSAIPHIIPASSLQAVEAPPTPSNGTVAEFLVDCLEKINVRYAFGLSGGTIVPVWEALEYSQIDTLHFRHENGAVFAACEYSIAADEPVAVFVTGGPGIANCINALVAARWEGAKIIFLCPYTNSNQRGGFAFQETTAQLLPQDLILSSSVFDFAEVLESPHQLNRTLSRALNLFQKPGGCIVSISIPHDVQTSPAAISDWEPAEPVSVPTCSQVDIKDCARRLAGKRVALWLGFGARGAVELVKEFAEKVGAAVMSTPRAKGIFPEYHPQYLGVTGFGGHSALFERLQDFDPEVVLVLGSKLGEFTSFWNDQYVTAEEFIHVDLDRKVFGSGFPKKKYQGLVSEIGVFLKQLLPEVSPKYPPRFAPLPTEYTPGSGERLCPGKVMQEIQTVFVDEHEISLMSEAGNSFAWATHTLSFGLPHYRVSTGYGSMGHAVSGVIGMALAHPERKAIALVGDGSMLMSGTEINTAVKYNIPAIWIVLNDGFYNMCRQGNALLGVKSVDCGIPLVDFVKVAHGLGADAMVVSDEKSLRKALEAAKESPRPIVLDVRIDPEVVPPFGQRISNLKTTHEEEVAS